MTNKEKVLFYAEYNQTIRNPKENLETETKLEVISINKMLTQADLEKEYINFLKTNKITNPNFNIVYDTYKNMHSFMFIDIITKLGFELELFSKEDIDSIFIYENKKTNQVIYFETSENSLSDKVVNKAILFGKTNNNNKTFMAISAEENLIRNIYKIANKEIIEGCKEVSKITFYQETSKEILEQMRIREDQLPNKTKTVLGINPIAKQKNKYIDKK